MILLKTFILSACSSEKITPYQEIDAHGFVRVTIIELNPKVFYQEGDINHSKPYQIAKVNLNFIYNDLIKSYCFPDFIYRNDDIVDALITEDAMKALNGTNEFISPSSIVEAKMKDEEGAELEFKGISFPGGDGSKALISSNKNNEKKLSIVFDGEYSFIFNFYNKRINDSRYELYDGCSLEQFTQWFLVVSLSYNKKIK